MSPQSGRVCYVACKIRITQFYSQHNVKNGRSRTCKAGDGPLAYRKAVTLLRCSPLAEARDMQETY